MILKDIWANGFQDALKEKGVSKLFIFLERQRF